MAPQTTTNRTFPAGTCLELTFANGDTVTYMVEREWNDDEEFTGLKVDSVGIPQKTYPRYRASLYPDRGILRDNYADDEDPETYDVDRMDVKQTADRICVNGSFASPRAAHVKRAVVDAIDALNSFDPTGEEDIDAALAAAELVKPEAFTLYDAGERSDADGVVLNVSKNLDLQTREDIEQRLRNALKDDYELHALRSGGLWEFRYGRGQNPVR